MSGRTRKKQRKPLMEKIDYPEFVDMVNKRKPRGGSGANQDTERRHKMRWIKAAEGPITNWVHVLVDDIAYCVSKKSTEICYEGKDPADLDVIMNDARHRKLLATRANIVHKEQAAWLSETVETWTLSYGSKRMKFDYNGEVQNGEVQNGEVQNGEVQNGEVQNGEVQNGKKTEAAGELTPCPTCGKMTPPHKQKDDCEICAKAPGAKKKDAAKMSSEAQEWISNKIRTLVDEGKKQDQAIAIAYSMARDKGYDVPEKKAAGDLPPFMKKDDDGADDKKDDKDDSPFGDKKDDKPKDKKDDKGGDRVEKALKALEKALKGEGDPMIEDLLKQLKDLLGGDKADVGSPPMPDLGPMMGPDKGPGMGGDMPMGPGGTGSSVPLSMAKDESPWIMRNQTGMQVGDRVWRANMVGASEYVGDDPGRVIATSGDKVVVDWGDDIPTEEFPKDLVVSETASGEDTLFNDMNDSNNAGFEATAGLESLIADSEEDEAARDQAEKLLKSMSLKEAIDRAAGAADDGDLIEHIATSTRGKFLAKSTDGRVLVRFGEEEVFLWPYEIRFLGGNVE